jgi:hypothetical protein
MNTRSHNIGRDLYIFGMHPFDVGGIHWGLLMELDFKSWRIGLIFVTFMSNNYEKSLSPYPLHTSFILSYLGVENMVKLVWKGG